MNPVNATSLYVSASRSVLQCDPRDPRALAELCKLLPFFRQSLSCLVCGECGFDLCIIVTINYSVGSWQTKQNRLKWCFQTRWVFPDTPGRCQRRSTIKLFAGPPIDYQQ